MLDAAKEKLRAITHGLPDPVYAQQEHLRLLNDAPGYAAFFLTSLDRHDRLLQAKPILVQGGFSPRFLPAPPRVALFNAKPLFPECVAHDPWKLLVVVMLLNKTAGRVAVPVFWTLITRWPTPESLAKG
jgi:hypothetical protein